MIIFHFVLTVDRGEARKGPEARTSNHRKQVTAAAEGRSESEKKAFKVKKRELDGNYYYHRYLVKGGTSSILHLSSFFAHFFMNK